MICVLSFLIGIYFNIGQCAPTGDLVDQLPGFPKAPFKVYSGYLNVPGPIGIYDSLKIHYQFHESQGHPANDPIVTWHQGGPGGSSLFGLFGEMGYFRVDTDGYHVNPYSWNSVANMLYLESPAGSSNPIGFSTCSRKGQVLKVCSFSDVTQAEAYAHTLKAFFTAFPEYSKNDLYLTGESYAGQYLPNIANFIVNNGGFGLNLKGIAVGNGCWGGDATHVVCNGPNEIQNDIDMYFGKGLASKQMYEEVYKVCNFPHQESTQCMAMVRKFFNAVGPHNIYDIYDNCPGAAEFLKMENKSVYWLHNYLRAELNKGNNVYHARKELFGKGGYDWSCGSIASMEAYLDKEETQKALHLSHPDQSRLDYDASGPASLTLYPSLAKKIRILIYNGDSDACVPYKGNEEYIDAMTDAGHLKLKKDWHPWYAEGDKAHIPAGYATTYSVPGSDMDFSFVTIRLAGHMVPTFRPKASLSFFRNFLAGKPF